MKIQFACLILFLSAISAAHAQFVADTTQNTIIQDVAGSEQSVPLSASTADGRTYISWFDNSGGQYALRMQLLDSIGQNLWPQNGIVVSNYPQSSGLSRYQLICDHDGNAVVAFQDERNGSMQIVAYKLNPQGEQVWGEAGISLTDSTSSGLSPVLTVLDNNDIIIAWSASGSGSRWVPFQKLASQSGQILWSRRIAVPGERYSRPGMVPSANGSFIMLYVKETGNFPPQSIMYAQRFSGETGLPFWSEPTQVSSKNIPFFFFPEIHSDSEQGFFLLFNTGNPVNPMLNDVYAQHVDTAGSIWTDEGIQLSMATDGNKYNGGYFWNPADSTLYATIRIQNGNQTMSGIAMQKINRAGQRLMGENAFVLREMSADLITPWLLLNAGDGLVCIFGSGGFNAGKIKGLKVDFSGIELWNYDPVAAASPSNKDDVSAGPFLNGQTVLVWSEDRNGDKGIYAQNLRTDGHFGVPTSSVRASIQRADVKLIPNPGREFMLSVQASSGISLEYRLLDITGREAETSSSLISTGINRIPVGIHLLPGVYLLEIRLGEEVQHLRLIKE